MKFNISKRAAAVVAVLGIAGSMPALAADSMTGKVSFGFQGVVAGNVLNGASVRGWTDGKLGWEGNLLYGHMKITPEGGNTASGDLWGAEVKGMYALVQKTNSKMYVGGKFAYVPYNLKSGGKNDLLNGKLYETGVLAGAEFCIPQLPEVGINFEVGYNYIKADNTVTGHALDMQLHGINAGVGIHYYF